MNIKGSAVAAATLLALCTFPMAPARAQQQMKAWSVAKFDNGMAVAGTQNESGSVLGLACNSSGQCVVFMTPASQFQCVNGSKHPIFVNSNSGAALLQTVCARVPQGGKKRIVLVFEDFEQVTKLILRDEMAGFCIPMTSGNFRVVRFSLSGSARALKSISRGQARGGRPSEILRDETL
jgi:hypothetical protein